MADGGLRSRLSRSVRDVPADLWAVVAVVLLTWLSVALPPIRGTPIRIPFEVALALFVSGYAVTAALFPKASESDGVAGGGDAFAALLDGEISGIARLALSVGTSVALVSFVGLALGVSGFGAGNVAAVLAVGVVTLAAALLAAVRRRRLPPEERFRVPYPQWYATVRSGLLASETRRDQLLNVLLAVALLSAAGSVAYGVTTPQSDESLTEFYLLTQQENGTLVAHDYPTEFVRGEPRTLVVGIDNDDRQSNYTVVVTLQRIEEGNDSARVLEERELHRFRADLDPGETWHHEHEIAPEMTGRDLRIQYLLYAERAPEEPRRATAEQELYLDVNVTDPENRSARLPRDREA